MITQQHEHEIQQKAQVPAPVKQHRWIVVLLSILGVALPLVAGWWVGGPWPLPDIFVTDWFLAIAVMVVVPVAVGAFLLCFALRAWWAAVFAGVAWFVSYFLGVVVRPLLEGRWPTLQGQEGIISLVLVPLLLGMLIGGAVGFAYGKERALRQ